MTEGYVQSQKKSYANQAREYLIPAESLGRTYIIPLGFQPLGIASKATADGDLIAIAAYFEPAVCLAKAWKDEAGLHLLVGWIRGVQYQGESVRLFPDIAMPGGANRCQTVNFGAKDLLVSRNAGRELFFLRSALGEDWELMAKTVLPGEGMVHSALLSLEHYHLTTIESSEDLNEWTRNAYMLEGNEFKLVAPPEPVPAFTYGAGRRSNDPGFYFVTDFRSQEEPGIYRERERVADGCFGNGICFLSDGSALVTRYGQGHSGPFNGVPGALIYIPAGMF